MMRGNRGEWSEPYVLLKLLAEGKLDAADENLNKIAQESFPLVAVIRNEIESRRREYEIDGDIVVKDSRKVLFRLPQSEFLRQSEILLTHLRTKSKTKGAFPLPDVEEFLRSIDITELKSKSRKTADITVVVYDSRTKSKPKLEFSIKSLLGQNYTLLNASGATVFVYEIPGFQAKGLKPSIVNSIYQEPIFRNRIGFLRSQGLSLNFFGVKNKTFERNLRLIDSDLHRILAWLLKYYYSEAADSSVSALVSELARANPLKYDLAEGHPFYEYKVKNFLMEKALGLQPATVWKGVWEVTGGILFVRRDGEVVCFHIFNRNAFREFLYNHMKFETPAPSRTELGIVRIEDQKYVMNLTLQIRSK